MPELPEVETLKRSLEKKLVGKKIKEVTVRWPKMVAPLTVTDFKKKAKDKMIKKIWRRAKMLVFDLSDGNHILVHLKMTGQLIFHPSKGPDIAGGHPQKGGYKDLPKGFTHLWLTFSDNSILYFNDLRKFAWMRYATDEKMKEVLEEYGLEPLSTTFTLENFKNIVSRYSKRKIKQLLTDQSLIAGIGNIYADETCFYARVLPTRITETLSEKEIHDLHKGIPEVLKLSIAKKGTSFRDYVQLDGKEGRMVQWLNVYNRAKQPCRRCGSPVKKITLNGRGTHFCPVCQH